MLRHPRMITHPRGEQTLTAEVVVIGSGAGGAVFAAEMAEAGHDVLLLEKGGPWDREDFDQREATMMARLYEDGGARTTVDGAITVLHASCVGGTTVVNNAICFDPPGFVLREWGEHGVKGLSAEALAPCVAKVNFVLGVQEMGEALLNRNAQVLERGARRLGLGGAPFRHNRSACTTSGFCMLGCSYDRKQSMLVSYVPRALHFGARLMPWATVERLEATGRKVVAARGRLYDPKTGERFPFEVQAKLFAVAGGAIGTPLLLLRSGLANSSGGVGANLRLHPLAPVFARFAQEIRGYEGIPQGYYLDGFLESRGFLLESIFTHPAVSAATIPGFGEPHRRLMADLNHFAAAYVQVRDRGAGTLALGPHGTPRIAYGLSREDAQAVREGYRHLARIFLAAGAEAVYLPHVDRPTLTHPEQIDRVVDALDLAPCKPMLLSAHQMGTARMGQDPSRSVVDSTLRAHDLDNLWIADGSVFPTPCGVNPQITIASLATWAARHARVGWRSPRA